MQHHWGKLGGFHAMDLAPHVIVSAAELQLFAQGYKDPVYK